MYFTAQALARKLKENLDLSIGGEEISVVFDSAGFPELKISKSSEAFFAKIEMIEPSGHVDGLGMVQRQYSPHKISVIVDPAATEKDVNYKLIVKCAALGMKVEIYEGAVLALANYAAAKAVSTIVSTIKSHEIFPQVLSV